MKANNLKRQELQKKKGVIVGTDLSIAKIQLNLALRDVVYF
jgi:hypothetical protein